jgi:hypothetical protein
VIFVPCRLTFEQADFSLSVNSDLGQGQLRRDQYLDYANRVEQALGMAGQPRALVFHTKEGREHCHIVWSRIDAQASAG